MPHRSKPYVALYPASAHERRAARERAGDATGAMRSTFPPGGDITDLLLQHFLPLPEALPNPPSATPTSTHPPATWPPTATP
eukprot:13896081-Alexandrium_andersonii.AAC.1